MVTVKKLPPGPEREDLHYDQHAGIRAQYPVSATFTADGEVESPGLAFEDYARMGTNLQKLAPNRRLPVPIWASNDAALKKLIVAHTEIRAGLRKNEIFGTEEQRLKRADEINKKQIESKKGILRDLCKDFVKMKEANPKDSRLRHLQIEIEGIDTAIRFDSKIPQMVAGVVYFYYRMGFNSVETGRELGMKPPHIRQTLWRLHKTWATIKEGWGTKEYQGRKIKRVCSQCSREFVVFICPSLSRPKGFPMRNGKKTIRKSGCKQCILCPDCKPPEPNKIRDLSALTGPRAAKDMRWLHERLTRAAKSEGNHVQ